MTDQVAHLAFWGKAGGAQCGEPAWHPLAYHSLDVAAVADVLLRQSTRKNDAISRLLGTTPDRARRILVALIALHDVGKFSRAFQSKSEEAWQTGVLGAYESSAGGHHDAFASEIREILNLKSLFGSTFEMWGTNDFDDLWHAVSGHHGQPRVKEVALITAELPETCREAARVFCQDITALFPHDAALPRPELRELSILSWLVAGLTVISDWIGSNRTWFPYTEPTLSVSDYWGHALDNAESAIARAGVLSASLPADASPTRLLPAAIADALSPLQRCVYSRSTIDDYVRRGLLPKPLSVGSGPRWRWADVEAWIAARNGIALDSEPNETSAHGRESDPFLEGLKRGQTTHA